METPPAYDEGMSDSQQRYWTTKGVELAHAKAVRRLTSESEEREFWRPRPCKGCKSIYCMGDRRECPKGLVKTQLCWDWQLDPNRKASEVQIFPNGLTFRVADTINSGRGCPCVLGTADVKLGRHYWAVRLDDAGVPPRVLNPPTSWDVDYARGKNTLHELVPNAFYIGVTQTVSADVTHFPGSDTETIGWSERFLIRNSKSEEPPMFAAVKFSVGDIIGVVLDFDSSQLTFCHNGAPLGSIFINQGQHYLPIFGARCQNAQMTVLPGLPVPEI